MSRAPIVLIVEDDPVFRRVISFTVARRGLKVETAADGLIAYDRMCRGDIRFLVTDFKMPRCNGVELIDRLDANERIQRPPTILCTAKGLELDTVELVRQRDLLAIMRKPFSPRKLSELILREIQNEADHYDTASAESAELAAEPETETTSVAVISPAMDDERAVSPGPILTPEATANPLDLPSEATVDE